MKHIIFYDSQNTWSGTLKRLRRDGDEFKRMARRYQDWANNRGDIVVIFDVSEHFTVEKITALSKRHYLFHVLESLASGNDKFDRAVFFMHGAKYNLNRHMVSIPRGNVGKFCLKLQKILTDKAKVVFYSCKTGRVNNKGFAATVAGQTGHDVVCHLYSGHTVYNPYKVIQQSSHYYPVEMFPPRGKWWWRTAEWKAYCKKMRVAENAFDFVEEGLS